ncbi:MAG: hypothetical protein J0L92_22600 [Deltaproteobacteria bacterium]|nr:hypothetical protein [Deltaproteobacteria bacterium]
MLGPLRSILLASCALAVAGCSIEHRRDEDTGADQDAALDAREPAPDAPLDAPLDSSSRLDAPCPPGFANCDGTCVNPLEDAMRCGADLACESYTVCVGNEACVEGVCSLFCEPGLTNCEGYCVSTQTDPMHCGASPEDCTGGIVCAAPNYCALGGCTPTCPAGLVLCFGRCIDPRSDRHYCGVGADCTGGAGSCFAGESCSDGACVTSCPAGRIACGGSCVDPSSDHVYCGATSDCSGATPCRAGEVCVEGACTTSCPSPQIACSGRCVEPASDETFCGARGDCTGGEACAPDFVCRDGACTPDCTADEIACDGACVDPRSDEAHCGASAACEGGVVCRAREACTAGLCTCAAPERDCGAGCVDTRFDRESCGTCGNACGVDEICVRGTCTSSTGRGLTGVFGTAWTASDFREVDCIQELVDRVATDLHVGGGAAFAAWDTLTATLRPDTPPPFPFRRGCSFASYGGAIFMLTSTDITLFQPPTHEWRTAPLGADLGPLGMTISDGTSLWSATASGFLLRASAATSTIDTIAVGTPMVEPRLTYDALADRIFFASQGSSELRSYDPVTRAFRLESAAPGAIGAAFCGDRAGHLYVGSAAAPRQLWQYTIASGTWTSLPLLSGSPRGTTNCGVDEAGALYVAEVPGTRLHRLALERR